MRRPNDHSSAEFELTFPKLIELMLAPFAFTSLMNVVVRTPDCTIIDQLIKWKTSKRVVGPRCRKP